MEYYVLQWNSLNFSYKSFINFIMKEKQISTFSWYCLLLLDISHSFFFFNLWFHSSRTKFLETSFVY